MTGNNELTARVSEAGRVVIPAELRQQLGIKDGDLLLFMRDSEGIRIKTLRQSTQEVQAFFRRYAKPGQSVASDLVCERREEAKRE